MKPKTPEPEPPRKPEPQSEPEPPSEPEPKPELKPEPVKTVNEVKLPSNPIGFENNNVKDRQITASG